MNVEDLPYTTLLASGAMKDGVKRLCNENIFAVLIMSILVCVLYSSLSKGDVYHTSSRPNKVQLLDEAIVKPCHLFIRANTYLFIYLHRRCLIDSCWFGVSFAGIFFNAPESTNGMIILDSVAVY